MPTKTIILILAFQVVVPVAFGDESMLQRMGELKGVGVATISSVPTPSEDRITLWLQETEKRGKGIQADLDDWQARWTLKFFDIDNTQNDVNHVLVISRKGTAFRLVDLEKEDVVLHRGDVLAIMLLPNSESPSDKESMMKTLLNTKHSKQTP